MPNNEIRFKIIKTDHTAITVSSLKSALDFWINVMGFRLISKETSGTGKWLDNILGVRGVKFTTAFVEGPGHTIELLEYHSPWFRRVMKSRNCDVGAFHISFTVDNLEATVKKVEQAGWRRIGKPQPPEDAKIVKWPVMLRNPDGTTLEFRELPKDRK
jgi:glyoxylase I family protein